MKIGFACKYLHHDQSQKKKLLEELQRPLNNRSTTVAWLNRQTKDVAEQKLWELMEHNIKAFYNLVNYVGNLSYELKSSLYFSLETSQMLTSFSFLRRSSITGLIRITSPRAENRNIIILLFLFSIKLRI